MNFNFLSPILGTLSQMHIKFVTALRGGRAVGTDEFGNRYYEERTRQAPAQSSSDAAHASRRWVIYKGYVDASEVPPEWHGWLHHQTDALPSAPSAAHYRRRWIKPYVPNMTGSSGAYLPPGHQLATAHRPKATGDYQAWRPTS